MTCGLNRQSQMNISSSWKNQQAITTKKPEQATLVPTKLNAREISAMTVKCTFCNDTKQEPGEPGRCVWCEEVEPVTLGTVTRYAESCGEGGGVVEHASGQFVEFKDYDAALAREAALREDLSMFVKAQLGISISEPGESFVQTTLRLFRMSKRRAAEFGIPEGENLEADIEVFEDYDALQQRLTVAEQRAITLGGLLRKVSELACERMDCELQFAVDDALKPAAEVAAYCTHPPGCKQCSWCGFKAEPKLSEEGEGS